MKLNVTFNNNISPLLKKQQREIQNLPEKGYKEFVKNTPIRSGNARRNTKLKNKKSIQANYPYAQKLDEGSSKQSPEGMIQPTQEYIVNEFYKLMGVKVK